MNEPHNRDSLDWTSDGRGRVTGIVDSGSGLRGCLARGELFLDIWTWGGLSRSQDGFERLRGLVIDMMNVKDGKLVGQLMTVLWELQRLRLVLGSTQGRRGRRGEETMADRTRDPIVLGKEREADVSIGFDEVVNR